MGDSLCCAGLSTCCQHGGYPWRAFVNETETGPTAATRPMIHWRGSRLRAAAPLPPSSQGSGFDTLTPRKLQPLKEITDAGANCCPVHSVVAN